MGRNFCSTSISRYVLCCSEKLQPYMSRAASDNRDYPWNVLVSLFSWSSTSVSSFNRSFSISSIAFVALVLAGGYPRRQPVDVSRSDWMSPYGSGFTEPNLLWGILLSTFTFTVCRTPFTCLKHSTILSTGEPSFSRLSKSGLHNPDPPPSPTFADSLLFRRHVNRRGLSGVLSGQQCGKDSILLVLGHRCFGWGFVNPTVQKDYASRPTGFIAHYLWGGLVFWTNFLKITSGVTGVFTETDLRIKFYLSFSKSNTFFHLPVGSPGPSFPSLASFLRSDSPSSLWRCLSISITVLLSCGAVRLGPEDAAEFVSTSFRGADWMLMSQFKVTIFLLSDHVVKATSTQSSTVLISLSSSFEDLSFLFYDVVVYNFNQRGWLISSSICTQAI